MGPFRRMLSCLLLLAGACPAIGEVTRIGETPPNVRRMGEPRPLQHRVDPPPTPEPPPQPASRDVASPPPPPANAVVAPTEEGESLDRQRWEAREKELERELMAGFAPPPIGTRITITPRIGRPKTGTITALGPNSVAIDGEIHYRSQLVPDTCAVLFAEDWAHAAAAARLAGERDSAAAARPAAAEEEPSPAASAPPEPIVEAAESIPPADPPTSPPKPHKRERPPKKVKRPPAPASEAQPSGEAPDAVADVQEQPLAAPEESAAPVPAFEAASAPPEGSSQPAMGPPSGSLPKAKGGRHHGRLAFFIAIDVILLVGIVRLLKASRRLDS